MHGDARAQDDAGIIRFARGAVVNRRIALWLLALALMAGFVALGRWQLQRADEKQRMLDQVALALAGRHAQSLSVAADEDTSAYAWASGRGHFVSAPVLLLDNQRRGDQVGVHVLAVFEPEGSRALLVDLGWLPVAGDRRMPEVILPAGNVAIAGLLTPPPAAGIALGAAHVQIDSTRWLLTRVDLAALATALHSKLATRVLRLDPALALGYARDLNVLPNTLPPERHRGYAVQWFGLALATLLVALFLGFRRRPQ